MKPAVLEVMRMNRVCRMVLVTSVGSFILVIFYFQSMFHPGRALQPHRPRRGQRPPSSPPAQVEAAPGALACCPRLQLSAPGAAAAGAGLGGGEHSARSGRGKVASPPAGNFPREGGKLVCLRILLFSALYRAFGEERRETTAAGERFMAEGRRELPGPRGSPSPGARPQLPSPVRGRGPSSSHLFFFWKGQGHRGRARAPATAGGSSASARPSCLERWGRLPGPVLPCSGCRGAPGGAGCGMLCRDHLGSTLPGT